MGLDMTSFLIGKQSGGGGGGGGGEEDLAMWKVGFFGSAQGETTNSITVTISGYKGKYALITIMHRSDLQTPPSGCVLLDKQTLVDYNHTQYISVFKYQITGDNVSLTFAQVSAGRMNASAWAVESDFHLGPCSRIVWDDYFNAPFSIATERHSFMVFNAYTSQTQQPNTNLTADSDGVWINQQQPGFIPPSTFASVSQVRHYSGVIPSGPKTSNLSWWIGGNVTITIICKAEIYVYAISKA